MPKSSRSAASTRAAISGADFRETICIAANHDGDSDSTADRAGLQGRLAIVPS